MVEFHATTICCVRRSADDVAIGGDGQVTMGESAIMKNGAVTSSFYSKSMYYNAAKYAYNSGAVSPT